MQVENDRRIDITTTSTHHQTFQWSQTHRCVNRLAVFDRTHRSTVA
ncbi:Uncharacterised protein [Vibrio cholerae]|nr:Uncharacterised protein [Vibrio cholerae]CSI65712.1 Uncharacterised protein [Vibrio cholerae]